MRNYFSAISIVFLGGCLIIGAWFISNSLSPTNVISTSIPQQNHQLLTRSELAEYLGISETEVDKLGPQPMETGGISQIPYLRIGDTTYFPLSAIEGWLLTVQGLSVE